MEKFFHARWIFLYKFIGETDFEGMLPHVFCVAPLDHLLAHHQRQAGGVSAGYVLLRLPLEIKDLFEEWLGAHYPDRKQHVLSLIRQTRDGAAYRSEWWTRGTGTGVYADLIRQRFNLARKRHGLTKRKLALDASAFCPPPAAGDQLTLF